MGVFQAAMPHKDYFNRLHKAYLTGVKRKWKKSKVLEFESAGIGTRMLNAQSGK